MASKNTIESLAIRIVDEPGVLLPGGNKKTADGSIMIEQNPEDVAQSMVKPKAQTPVQSTGVATQTQPTVRCTIQLAVGTINTEYSHIYKGEKVLVVGLSALSFLPAIHSQEAPNILEYTIPEIGSISCVNVGLQFVDSTGTTNIILLIL